MIIFCKIFWKITLIFLARTGNVTNAMFIKAAKSFFFHTQFFPTLNFLIHLPCDLAPWCTSNMNDFIHEAHDFLGHTSALRESIKPWPASRSPGATALDGSLLRSETYCCLSPWLYHVHISAAALINARDAVPYHSSSYLEAHLNYGQCVRCAFIPAHPSPPDSLMELIIRFVAMAVNGELVGGRVGVGRGGGGVGLFVASSSFTDHI